MNKVQQKRLLSVAIALRDAAKAKMKLDMEVYVFSGAEEDGGLCGTPACALGHYAARTDMQRLLMIRTRESKWDNRMSSNMVFRGSGDLAAYEDAEVLNHFGIDYDHADEIFGPEGCGNAKTPLAAAKYIERFVAKAAKS